MAAQHSSQFPGQVVGIGNAGVAAACTKGADHFSRVAYEKHTTVLQLVQALGFVGIRPDPDNLALHIAAELFGQSFAHHVFAADIGRVCVRCHLVINAPDIVAHQVLPDCAVVVERGLDPGVAFGGRCVCEAHIGNAPAVIAAFAVHGRTHPIVKRCV